MVAFGQPFIDVDLLKAHFESPSLVILDCSTVTTINSTIAVPGVIPNARFFDLKTVFKNKNSDLPNTVPSRELFQKGCRRLGINNDSFIVVYDNIGIYTSPRVAWLFKYMGFNNVTILNGGLKEWKAKGYDVTNSHLTLEAEGNFIARQNIEAYRSFGQIKENLISKNELLIDARSSGRFKGEDPEPRKGIASGSIPNSINIHYKQVLDDHLLKSDQELLDVFSKVKSEKNLVFSCGSGTTASIVLAAASKVLNNHLALFDGSWTEWAKKMELQSGK